VNLKIKPIGVIKTSNSGLADLLIYSDFEKVIGDTIDIKVKLWE
jgi:hypothetical protein